MYSKLKRSHYSLLRQTYKVMQKYNSDFPYFEDQFYNITKQFLQKPHEFCFLGKQGHLLRENLLISD